MPISEQEFGWLAGIFDGEGSARIYQTRGRFFIQVQVATNTDWCVIERAANDLKELGFGFYIRENGNRTQKKSKPWWRACYDVRISKHQEVFAFLSSILPLLTGERKKQVELVLAFLSLRKSINWKKRWRNKQAGQLENERALYLQQMFNRQPNKFRVAVIN